MSSREPMWYCHECRAEMRPLMVPDPHCASCNGTFVEKIEEEADDPRAFASAGPILDDDDFGPQGMENFIGSLAQLMEAGRPRGQHSFGGSPSIPSSPQRAGSGFRIEINRSAPGRGGTRTFVLGGPPTLGGTRRDPSDNTPSIAGPLMAQYLMSLLASRGMMTDHGDHFGPAGLNFMMGGEEAENGRWGDYVFNQEALDQIISQIMENSNSSHPVPATQEVMDKLDRTVLEDGSPLLERDCAVCKEQFSLTTEDPDEQVVVTLPCKHPFHEGCITPWLNSSGTCPVCRYQLVPQPEHHPPGGPRPPNAGPGSPPRQAGPGSPPRQAGFGNPPTSGASGHTSSGSSGGGGVFSSLFNMVSGGYSSGSGSASGSSNSSSNSSRQQRDPPGSWRD